MNDPLLRFKIAISLIPNIGPVLSRRLIAYCGSIEGVFHEKKKGLLKIPGIGDKTAVDILQSKVLDLADQEVEFVLKNGIRTLFYLDDNYPRRLQHCEDAPILLYCRGNADFDMEKVISVVGTRNATAYGREACIDLITRLALNGHQMLIVSGLAFGIDIAAHKAALKAGLPTVGALGHGLTKIYPGEHREYASKIIDHGALITEFTAKTGPDAPNFVRRNRIIAGLADATIVVESGVKGGALITADIANSYNRDVLAYPGRTGDKGSAGCNKLIKTNRAALIEDAGDLEYVMGWQQNKQVVPVQTKLFVELSPEEQQVMELFANQPQLTVDEIARASAQPLSKIAYQLINLEFNGLLKCLPGKVYVKSN